MEGVAASPNPWHPTLIQLQSISSTQDWVRDWARMQAREGLILTAREQTAGRGRLQRTWESPSGGLYLSLLLRPPIAADKAHQLIMLVSLAAIEACQQVAGVQPRPKWPNDLLLEGKKLAGVLTELEITNAQLNYAIIGLGLNVNNHFEHGPLAQTATSLRMVTGKTWDVSQVRDAFIAALGRWYARFRAGESPVAAWAQNLEPIGRQVMVQQPARPPWQGRAVGVSPAGALLVEDDDAQVHTIWAGDVMII